MEVHVSQAYSASGDDRNIRVTLIGKPDCHLCQDALAVIERVCTDLGVGFEVLSILDDASLADRYFESIPVTLVDGKPHDLWRVDEARLRTALLK